MEPKPRLGRIRYINVLPIYYAIDQAWVDNGFDLVAGTPAELNCRLHQGHLDVSAISSYEYGRHCRDYLLLPQLSIATRGDVGSVLFFSRLPFHRLSGKEVLLSAGSATSAALVKIVLRELYGARPCTGQVRLRTDSSMAVTACWLSGMRPCVSKPGAVIPISWIWAGPGTN